MAKTELNFRKVFMGGVRVQTPEGMRNLASSWDELGGSEINAFNGDLQQKLIRVCIDSCEGGVKAYPTSTPGELQEIGKIVLECGNTECPFIEG